MSVLGKIKSFVSGSKEYRPGGISSESDVPEHKRTPLKDMPVGHTEYDVKGALKNVGGALSKMSDRAGAMVEAEEKARRRKRKHFKKKRRKHYKEPDVFRGGYF